MILMTPLPPRVTHDIDAWVAATMAGDMKIPIVVHDEQHGNAENPHNMNALIAQQQWQLQQMCLQVEDAESALQQ